MNVCLIDFREMIDSKMVLWLMPDDSIRCSLNIQRIYVAAKNRYWRHQNSTSLARTAAKLALSIILSGNSIFSRPTRMWVHYRAAWIINTSIQLQGTDQSKVKIDFIYRFARWKFYFRTAKWKAKIFLKNEIETNIFFLHSSVDSKSGIFAVCFVSFKRCMRGDNEFRRREIVLRLGSLKYNENFHERLRNRIIKTLKRYAEKLFRMTIKLTKACVENLSHRSNQFQRASKSARI